MKSQAEVARQLRALTDAASSPAEHERLNYLTRFVEFLTPYSESWSLAHNLHLKLQQASELKKQNKADEARQLILAEGVPLWLQMAPKVREVFLDYQEIVSTRNDLGQLASMHNKYERLALVPAARLDERVSGGIAAGSGTDRLRNRARPMARPRRGPLCPRAPPCCAKGNASESPWWFPGPAKVVRATLFTRSQDTQAWSPAPMKLERKADLHGRAPMARKPRAPCWIITLRQKWKRAAPRKSSPRRRKRRSDIIR